MPYYSVRKKDENEVKALPLMSYEQLQKFLSDNPEYELVLGVPGMVKVN